MMKKNKNLIIVISVFIGALLILGSFIVIHNYNESKSKEVLESYVIVREVNKDSIVVEDTVKKETKTYLTDGSNYKKGDLIAIKSKGSKIEDYKVIVEDYMSITTSPIIIEDPTEIETTTVTTTTTNNQTTTVPNNTTRQNTTNNTTVKTTTIVKTTTSTKTTLPAKDETVLKYVEEETKTIQKGENTETFKEKSKKKFIEIVDFLYYGGTIKGVTLKDVKSSTKAKIIYYALLIDAAIDSRFPGYKQNISDKYKDIKSRLIAEFLDIKYDVCLKSGDDCNQVPEDWKLLKTSLKLTWDFIKGCFGYVKNLTVPKIKSWYESFRG